MIPAALHALRNAGEDALGTAIVTAKDIVRRSTGVAAEAAVAVAVLATAAAIPEAGAGARAIADRHLMASKVERS
jgi:hypothetical protein